jgi:hypothetical protein
MKFKNRLHLAANRIGRNVEPRFAMRSLSSVRDTRKCRALPLTFVKRANRSVIDDAKRFCARRANDLRNVGIQKQSSGESGAKSMIPCDLAGWILEKTLVRVAGLEPIKQCARSR